MDTNDNKVHIFEVSAPVDLKETELKKKLEEFMASKLIDHEVKFATNKKNVLRFKVDSEFATHGNISGFTSLVENVVPGAGTSCPGFGVPDTDLATFVEKPTAVLK